LLKVEQGVDLRESSSVELGVIALVSALLLFAFAFLMPSSWLARSNIAPPGSPIPPSAGVLFFRAALLLNGLLLLLWSWSNRRSTPAAQKQPSFVLASPTADETPRRVYLWMGILLLLAAVLRFWKLDGDLWFDEVMDLVYYVRGSVLDILIRFPGFFPQIVSALASKLSISLMGESAWAFRLPEVVFGILGVWAIYSLTRLLTGTREALMTALLLATSYHHVFFSQNARGYSIQVFFTTLATTAFLRASSSNRHSAWAAYALFSILNLYTHIFAIFVWAGLSICYLGRWLQQRFETGRSPSSLQAFLWSSAFIASVTFLLYSPMTPGLLARAGVTMPSPSASPPLIRGFLPELLQGLQAGYGSAATLVLLIVFLAGLGSLARRSLFGAAVLMLPVALGLGVVFVLHMEGHPRYFIYALPAGVIVIVRGLVATAEAAVGFLRLREPERLIRWASAGLIGAVALISLRQLVPYYAIPKQDFSGALAFAEQRKKPDDALVAVGMAAHAYSVYYAPSIRVARSANEVNALRQGGQRVWLLYTLPFELQERNPELWRYIQEHFEVVRRFPGTIRSGTLYVCRAEPSLVGEK